MADLVVIVPSRGRPGVGGALALACKATCTADTLVFLAIDSNDPARAEYEVAAKPNGGMFIGPTSTMNEALNMWATSLAEQAVAVAFMGDDHRPRTVGWDAAYLDALRELGTGIVYGNDLLQGERLPTQVAMTSDIIRVLGHMAPPTLIHMYLDNYWKELGEAAGCLRYLPDVVVEHVHPIAQGLPVEEWDEGHRRVNTGEMFAVDHAAYVRWKYMHMPAEVAKVKALREARVA